MRAHPEGEGGVRRSALIRRVVVGKCFMTIVQGLAGVRSLRILLPAKTAMASSRLRPLYPKRTVVHGLVKCSRLVR